MSKPIIGLAGNMQTIKEGPMFGLEHSFVNADYITSVEKAGGVPIVLPIIEDEESIRFQLKACHGIVITGGYDVHPIFYNEEPHEKLKYVNSSVDEFHIKVIKIALEENKPLLGICRGHQILNVVCRGTLYQDLSEMPGQILKHFQEGKPHDYSHKIKIKSNSILNRLFGEETLVNSYHHQCIKELGEELEVVATALDGAVEAVEMKDRDFVVGVQWHPEKMIEKDDKMLDLFKELVRSCK